MPQSLSFHDPSKAPQGFGLRQSSGAFRWFLRVRKRQRTAAVQDAAAWFMLPMQSYLKRSAAWQRRAGHAVAGIPTGFGHKAQGCEERATLGNRPRTFTTPTGLRHPATRTTPQPRWGCGHFSKSTQGSSFLATLGLVTQSRWDCSAAAPSKIF